MKLSTLAAVIVSAGIAQVAAVPIRVILVSTSVQQDVPNGALEHARFGHSVEHNPAVAMMRTGGVPRPCKGRLGPLRQKGVEISNTFRQALGWPLIEEHPHHHSHPHHSHHHDKTSASHVQMIKNGQVYSTGEFPTPSRHGSHRMRVHHHEEPFLTRVQLSLANLGRWEGRAVAFVLGCGIGVLLRMFAVLFIVLYRSVRPRQPEQDEYSHIVIYDADEVFAAPAALPPYSVDEKVALEADNKIVDPVKVAEDETK